MPTPSDSYEADDWDYQTYSWEIEQPGYYNAAMEMEITIIEGSIDEIYIDSNRLFFE